MKLITALSADINLLSLKTFILKPKIEERSESSLQNQIFMGKQKDKLHTFSIII